MKTWFKISCTAWSDDTSQILSYEFSHLSANVSEPVLLRGKAPSNEHKFQVSVKMGGVVTVRMTVFDDMGASSRVNATITVQVAEMSGCDLTAMQKGELQDAGAKGDSNEVPQTDPLPLT